MSDAYAPPLRDIRFVLDHLVDADGLAKLPPFGHADADSMFGLLEEYARFVREVLAPLNRPGDAHGASHDPATGAVTTTPGWPDAYRRYVEAGWSAVPFAEEYGGGGFPWLLAVAMQELLTSANMAFSLCPLLTQGAIDMLGHHGDEEQRERYLPKLVSGEWTGTMNLTEPQAGSDLGAIATRAVPADDGVGEGAPAGTPRSWRVSGQKIFITYGEHDLAANIVHLVLARVPDAPPGTKGLSCFIVPKHLVGDDGTLAEERNGVTCIGIEHKLGIHGSPTCTLEFDDAVGYLIGEANAGMRYMFTMMNNARLSVGLEGLAVAERAYQQALAYAQERTQGRAVGAAAGSASAIIEHPDVRRMLLHMRSHIEAMRGLTYANARAIDDAKHHPDHDARSRGQERADLLTPLSKGWCTDLGSELTRLATQVHGGMGFITETGIAQHERDVRIAAIYEGTNGIQALDLVGRKLGLRAGGVVADLLADIDATAREVAAAGAALAGVHAALVDGVGALREATDWLLANGSVDPRNAQAGATPYLRLAGTVVGGWVMARQALAASGSDDPFLAAKVATARYYCEQVLPTARGLLPAVTAGPRDLDAVAPSELLGA